MSRSGIEGARVREVTRDRLLLVRRVLIGALAGVSAVSEVPALDHIRPAIRPARALNPSITRHHGVRVPSLLLEKAGALPKKPAVYDRRVRC